MRDDDQFDEQSHQLTAAELEIIHQMGTLSVDEFESLERLIENEPDIITFFSKRKAYALVFGSLQRVVTWFAAFSGAVWLGFDKISAMFKWIIQILLQ